MDIKSTIKVVTFSLLCIASGFLFAVVKQGNPPDLLAIFEEAAENDPVFKKAYADRLATQEAYPQARAALLPALSLSGQAGRQKQTLKGGNSASLGSSTGNIHDYQVNLTQTLFNFGNWSRLKEANATVKKAVATYNAAAQDLILRVAIAYLDVLEAADTLRVTRAEKVANERQLSQAKQRYDVGVDTITSVYDAQASYDAVVANMIVNENNLKNKKEILQEITSVYHPDIAKLKTNVPLMSPNPSDVASWVKIAVQRNYILLASQYSAEVARAAINTAQGGHLPTVDLFANYDDNFNANSAAFSSATTTRDTTLGVQLNVPVFQGGLISSQVRQAHYNHQSAKDEHDRIYKSVISQTRQSYNNIMSSLNVIKADRQAVRSAESSLKSTQAAFEVGTRTIVDVLDSQKNLYDTQRRLAQDEYTYIKVTLILKQASGLLSIKDLEQVNSLLMTSRKWVK